jgi:hypothetical protein
MRESLKDPLELPANPEEQREYAEAIKQAESEGATDFEVIFQGANPDGENSFDSKAGALGPDWKPIYTWIQPDNNADRDIGERKADIAYALVAKFPEKPE